MGKIVAWECEDTGTIFKVYDDYRNHRRRLTYANRREKRIQEVIDRQKKKIMPLYDLSTLPEIVDFVNNNFQDLYRYAFNEYKMKTIPLKFKLTVGNTRYMECLSNTHCSPKNGVDNWHCDPELPRGYPGISGRVFIEYEEPFRSTYDFPPFWTSELMKFYGLHTGSGGGGGGELRFDVSIFLDDFPGLADTAMMAKLSGKDIGKALTIKGYNLDE